MAGTTKTDKTGKNLFKLGLAILVLVFLGLFLRPETYTLLKKQFVKNSNKYIEMYAYAQSRPLDKKYFVLQGNDVAKSFFRDQVSFVNEDGLKNLSCTSRKTVILYEKSTSKVQNFIKKEGGTELTLNSGTDIKFYAAIVKNKGGTCKI